MLRYERKYLVTNDKIDALRERIKPFVDSDMYAVKDDGTLNGYTVRSIYFDSPTLTGYFEKTEGFQYRTKLRIRGYNKYESNPNVYLEIKRKIDARIGKNRGLIKFDDLSNLLATGDVDKYIIEKKKLPNSKDDAKRFLYHLNRYQLKPIALVTYDREPFTGLFDKTVRLTFDKNIRVKLYPNLIDLYNDHDLISILKKYFIFEVKYYTNEMPSWAHSIIEEFGLRHEALSKYTIGLDVLNSGIRRKFSPISYFNCANEQRWFQNSSNFYKEVIYD